MLTEVSPPLSFKGWLLSVWFVKNKDFVKTALTIYSTVVGAVQLTTLAGLAAVGYATLGLLLSLGIKLAADAVDFFFSAVELK